MQVWSNQRRIVRMYENPTFEIISLVSKTKSRCQKMYTVNQLSSVTICTATVYRCDETHFEMCSCKIIEIIIKLYPVFFVFYRSLIYQSSVKRIVVVRNVIIFVSFG